MKKILLLFLLMTPLIIYANSAESYIVLDANNNRVLDGKNINKEKLIASTTKIMTAMIIIENYDLNQEVVVDDAILKAFGSSMYLEIEEKLKVIDLLYGLLLRSGNDAAIVLANLYSGDMESFSKIMNEYAKRIGMNNTNFINSSGLENDQGMGNTSTAYDMALLMSYAINNPIFVKISGTKYYSFKSSKKEYNLKNKNKLLFNDKRVIAGKTGYTMKARRTLVTAANSGNRRIIVVTLNDGNDFNDHESIYNNFFKNYHNNNLCNHIKKIDDPLNLYHGYSFIYNDECNVLLSREERKRIEIDYILFNGVNITNNVDRPVGYVNFKLDDEVIYQNIIKIKPNKSPMLWLKEFIYGK